MQLTHSFTVPVDRPTAWAAFQDVASVAECFPGATVTSAEGDEFTGTCKVKLGPIALQYSGSGTFLERDEAAGRLVLEAKGRDKRGNGTAGANVTATFVEADPGSTRVEVVTDLNITGKPAQFGRGVIQDVSDKLLGQFVGCLESRIAAPPAPQPTGQPQQAPPSGPVESVESVESVGPAVDARIETALETTADATGATTGSAATVGSAATAATAAPAGAERLAGTGITPPQDALDLGATVLPVLARTYWRQVAGALLVLLVFRWLWGRRR